MRLAVVSFIVLSLAGVARGAERTLSIEAELMGPKDRSLGKTQVLVAARGTDLERHVLHAPIGLPIGGDSPGEIAISILAEMIQTQYGSDEPDENHEADRPS